MSTNIKNQPWPEQFDERDSEHVDQIQPDYIQWADFEYDDPYFDHIPSYTHLFLYMNVNGSSTCLKTINHEVVSKIRKMLDKSDDFYFETQIPYMYGEWQYHRISTLTNDIVATIKQEDILYAEVVAASTTHPNGKALIYVKNDGGMICYRVKYNPNIEFERNCYLTLLGLLTEAKEKNILATCIEDNIVAYINRKIALTSFVSDKDYCSFSYYGKETVGTICVSSEKLLKKLDKEYTAQLITDNTVNKYKKYLDSDHLNEEERRLVDLFVINNKKDDSWQNWITVNDYYAAVRYILYINNLSSHTESDEYFEKCTEILTKYRIRYLMEKLGENILEDAITRFDIAKAKPGDLAKKLSELLGEDISKKFTKYVVEKRKSFDIDGCYGPEICYPVVISLPKSEHEKIVKKILSLDSDEIVAACQSSLGYYLANCEFCIDTLELATIMPAAFHIVRNMPLSSYYYDNSKVSTAYWFASDLINTGWIMFDKEAPQKYLEEIYHSCYEVVGDVWPIRNYGKFRFGKNNEEGEVAERIFNEALGYLLALDEHLETLNPELYSYLNTVKESDNELLEKYILLHEIKRMPCKKAMAELWNDIELDDVDVCDLAYCIPTNKKRAKTLIDELLKGDDGIYKAHRQEVWCALLSRMYEIGLGSYILTLVITNYEAITKDFDDDISLLFYCACESPESDMIPLLEEFRSKVLMMPGIDRAAIDGAMEYAKKFAKTAEFQRKALMKVYA